MFDLYPYLMTVVSIATVLTFSFICYVEVRHKKVLQFNKKVKESLNSNTISYPKYYLVTTIDHVEMTVTKRRIPKPSFIALMFYPVKLKVENYFLFGEIKLMFKKEKMPPILKKHYGTDFPRCERQYAGGYFIGLQESSRVNSNPNMGHEY